MRERGLSLLELCLAVGILATAILTMVGVYVSAIRLGHKGHQHVQALELARRELESIQDFGVPANKAQTWDGRVPQPKAGDFPPDPYPGITTDQGEYALVVKLTPSQEVEIVQVDVFWKGGSVSLVTQMMPP